MAPQATPGLALGSSCTPPNRRRARKRSRRTGAGGVHGWRRRTAGRPLWETGDAAQKPSRTSAGPSEPTAGCEASGGERARGVRVRGGTDAQLLPRKRPSVPGRTLEKRDPSPSPRQSTVRP